MLTTSSHPSRVVIDRSSADPAAAQLVQLRYFSGLTMARAAEALDLAPRTADRLWVFARAWLFRELSGENWREPGVDSAN